MLCLAAVFYVKLNVVIGQVKNVLEFGRQESEKTKVFIGASVGAYFPLICN